MYAIIETGGKQYKVHEGLVLKVEKIDGKVQDEVEFLKVLAVIDGEKVRLGTPYVEGAVVKGRILEQGKDKKIIVFKYKPKKNYRRKQGHRQPFTRVLIEKVSC